MSFLENVLKKYDSVEIKQIAPQKIEGSLLFKLAGKHFNYSLLMVGKCIGSSLTLVSITSVGIMYGFGWEIDEIPSNYVLQ